MKTPTSIQQRDTSLARDGILLARHYLGSRNVLLALAAIAIVAGIGFNWNWLVATGLAPVLVAALPCAVMCGLGLCFHRLFGASCASEQSRPTVAADRADEIAAPPNRATAISSASDSRNGTPDAATVAQNKMQSDNERRDFHA